MNRFFILFFLIIAVMVSVSFSENMPAINSGLAGHWKFDELSQNSKTIPDASGTGNHGLVQGQVLVDGIIGSALEFAGYDQIVEVGNLNLKAPATVAFWVKTNDVFHERMLFSQMEGTENLAGALRFDGTQIELWDGSNWLVLIDHHIRINKWLHIAVVFDENGKTSGFLNGERQHLVRCGFDFSSVKAAIGSKFLGKSGNVFIGKMDDFRIYRKALSGNEINSLYVYR